MRIATEAEWFGKQIPRNYLALQMKIESLKVRPCVFFFFCQLLL